MHLATDVGGTFTDFAVLERGRLRTFKLPSSPAAPQRTVARGLRLVVGDGGGRGVGGGSEGGEGRAAGDMGRLRLVSHASTVATNAVLERKGARVAFVTTKGFGDLLHIGRQDRPRLYAFDGRRPKPLVSPKMCFEVAERLDPQGEVLRPLSPAEAAEVVAQAKAAGAEALAVCLLHSYANSAHELLMGEAAAGAGLPSSLSSQVWPEFREYERASTTVMDAFLRPVVAGYVAALRELLAAEAPGAGLRLMVSSGAVVPAGARAVAGAGVNSEEPGLARTETSNLSPVSLLLSGPASGVAAAAHVAKLVGEPNVVTLDMGGTSTDVSLLLEGKPQLTTSGRVAGLPVRLSRVAIETVGAGGGSLAKAGPGGMLQVGPQSAGAEPGPASYGLGGEGFTVTDALLLAGWLPPLELPGGIKLEPGPACAAARPLAKGLGLTVEATAAGVIEVALATMLRSLEALTIRQGHHPRELALMAFGGAGPLVACGLARRLGCRRVVVPAHAGVFSALGLALSPVRFHRSKALMVSATASQPVVKRAQRELTEVTQKEAKAAGLDPAMGVWEWSLDCRYTGQSHELNVPLPPEPTPTAIGQAFAATHQRTNGYAFCDEPVELVALRCALGFPAEAVALPRAPEPTEGRTAPTGRGRLLWQGAWLEALQYRREGLPAGFSVEGPALLLGRDSTALVAPEWTGQVDRWGNVLLEVA